MLVRDFAAVRRELENPLRIDSRNGSRKELGRLNDFPGDNPLRLMRFQFLRRLVAFERWLARRFAARIKDRAGEDGQLAIALTSVRDRVRL